ncbi:immunity protein Imm33 domain-containing protein [Mangrovivirga halotolerans]
MCIKQLAKYIKMDLTEYLDLSAGYRFLIDGNNYENVWHDESLVDII